jgi:hypothetical protein
MGNRKIVNKKRVIANPPFGIGSAYVVLKAKLRFAASRETCLYLRRSETLRRTEAGSNRSVAEFNGVNPDTNDLRLF